MYFASDVPDPQIAVATLIEHIQRRSDLNWMALVDSAFDYGNTQLRWNREKFFTYGCDKMGSLIDASPFLVDLRMESIRPEVGKLIRHRGNRPMISFIGTELTPRELNETWSEYLTVRTTDDQNFVLRFADTRVLPALSQCLGPELWNGLTVGVKEWLYINRRGDLQTLNVDHTAIAALPPRRMTTEEFSAIIEAGEPDAIIDILSTNNPEILSETDRVSVYQKVCSALAVAKTYAITSYRDIVAWVTLVVVTNGAALTDDKVIQFLDTQSWSNGHLADSLIQFA